MAVEGIPGAGEGGVALADHARAQSDGGEFAHILEKGTEGVELGQGAAQIGHEAKGDLEGKIGQDLGKVCQDFGDLSGAMQLLRNIGSNGVSQSGGEGGPGPMVPGGGPTPAGDGGGVGGAGATPGTSGDAAGGGGVAGQLQEIMSILSEIAGGGGQAAGGGAAGGNTPTPQDAAGPGAGGTESGDQGVGSKLGSLLQDLQQVLGAGSGASKLQALENLLQNFMGGQSGQGGSQGVGQENAPGPADGGPQNNGLGGGAAGGQSQIASEMLQLLGEIAQMLQGGGSSDKALAA